MNLGNSAAMSWGKGCLLEAATLKFGGIKRELRQIHEGEAYQLLCEQLKGLPCLEGSITQSDRCWGKQYQRNTLSFVLLL